MVNPYVFPAEIIDICKYWNIKVIAYCPLGYNYSEMLLREANVENIASQIGCSPSQVILSWLVKQGLYVIPRSCNAEHLKCNLESQEVDWQINGAENPELKRMMRSLQKTNDEVFSFMIDLGMDAFFQELTWGKDFTMQAV